MKKGLNRNQLKYIAIIAMVLDHIAFLFIPQTTDLYCIFRIIGKLTAPIMCYFLAEGFNYTSSKFKYGTRLLFFGIISQFAFSLTFYNRLFVFKLNMIFTLFLGFLVLLCYDKISNKLIRWISIICLVYFSNFCDWGIFAPLWALCFYIFKEKKVTQIVIYYLVTTLLIVVKCILISRYSWTNILIQLGLFLFIPMLFIYNGEKGKTSKFNKWFFYIFYPLHLIILYFA